MFMNIYFSYIDFFTAFIILMLIIAMLIKKSYFSYAGTQLLIICFIIFILSSSEAIAFIVDGNTHWIGLAVNRVANFIAYLLTPVLLGFLGIYIHYLVNKRKPKKLSQIVFFIPAVLVFIMLIINIFNPFIYFFNADNEYLRAGGYIYTAITSYLVALYLLGTLIAHIKVLEKWVSSILIFSFIITLVGAILQIFNEDLITLYPFMGISVIAIYISFESIGVTRDDLTKVFVRKMAFEIIKTHIVNNRSFVITMFDMDNLKDLNDQHGHFVGDEALVHFVEELQRVFHKNDILARFGGDEFILICRNFKIETIHAIIKEVKSSFIYQDKTYDYSFSFGSILRQIGDNLSVDELITLADKNMYEMKNHKRMD